MNRREKILSVIVLSMALSIVLLGNTVIQYRYQFQFNSQIHYMIVVSITRHSLPTNTGPGAKGLALGKSITIVNMHNTFMTEGAAWLKAEIGDPATASTNTAHYISLSNSSSTPLVSWTQLTTEENQYGLARAAATYTSTGNGSWNESKTFTFTATQTVYTGGLNWLASGDANLISAGLFTSAVNGLATDTMTVTFMCSVTGT